MFIKRNKKMVSFVLIIIFILTLINIPTELVYAQGESIKLGDSESPPEISIDYVGTTPKYPIIGDDIEVTYKITADEFNYIIPGEEKEIILVLDLSESMRWCSEEEGDSAKNNHNHEGGTCILEKINLDTGLCEVHNEKLPHYNYGEECTNSDGYCEVHNTSGKHNVITSVCNVSRLDMTKYAAINFINKLSDVGNLKIGLVTYNKYAEVYEPVEVTENIENGKDINEENRNNLINYIKELNTETGTNIGEALRKTAYLLGDNTRNDINRSIVLMTDGKANKYSATDSKGLNYYEDINLENPEDKNIKVNSIGVSSNSPLDYSKFIGRSISRRNYNNIYSIGYALGDIDSETNLNLREIHTSMGGSDNTFFVTQGSAIDEIFDQIADNIKLDYKFHATMSFTLNKNFESIDNMIQIDNKNIVSIPSIEYKLKDGSTKEYLPNNKEVEEIYFTFKIKAMEVGGFDLFNEGTIKYIDVGGNIKEVTINSPKVSIYDKKSVPVIEAYLSSDEVVHTSKGGEVEVSYNVVSQSFESVLGNNTDDKEVVFIIDTSKGMEALSKVKTSIVNRMLNHFLNNGSKMKFNIITYNSKVQTHEVDSEAKDQNNVNIDYRNELQNKILNITNSQSNDRNLGKAIKAADDFFNKNNNINSIKNMIIISSGDPTDEFPDIDISKYNVITLATNKADTYDKDRPEENYKNNYIKLKQWHDLLGGLDNNYFISSYHNGNVDIDSNTDQASYNPLAPNGDIMAQMADRITGMNYSLYTIKDVNLNFDLAYNFEAVDNMKIDENGEYYVEVPYIKFLPKEKVPDSNEYIFEAEPLEVTFTVKVKDDKIGELEFGKNTVDKIVNYVSYTKINNEITNNAIEKTPKVIIEEDPIATADIRILEIEPADSFAVTKNSKGYIQSGREITSVKLENGDIKSVVIDHISMSEFIGNTEKINGAYDVVFIGRYIDTKNITTTKNQDQLAYIDYGTGEITIQSKKSTVENDITNRKATEILEYIDSGQLTYIDNSIVSNNTEDGRRSLKGKNIYDSFQNIIKSNLKNEEINYSKSSLLNAIVNEYYSTDIGAKERRINLEVNAPRGDDENSIEGNINNRNLVFDVNLSDKFSNTAIEEVEVNLYLDINGDGLYKENELFVTEKSAILSSLQLNYVVPTDFIGYLSWKIEVVRECSASYTSECKTYKTGELLLRQVAGKKKIRVLEVSPYETKYLYDKIGQTEQEWYLGNLNLSENERFQDLINNLPDYDIDITTMSMSEFNSSTEELNGKYDMVIFGFADNFRGWDLNENGVKQIKSFIKTGQGVMLTHDTLTKEGLENFKSIFNNTKKDEVNLAGLTDELTLAHKEKLEWPNFQTKEVYQTNNGIITSYPFLLDETISIRRTHGQWYQLNLEDEDVIPWYTGTANTVWSDGTSDKKGNGSIEDYHNGIENDSLWTELEKELIKNYGTIRSAIEKVEYDDNWFTNNLQKKDGVSYDGLNTNTEYINKYDVKNNYYTYSSGNITFSGTGENNKERNTPYPTSELQLFVNTIVKAERLANHAPVINTTIPELESETVLIQYNKEYIFDVTPTDIDQDNVKITVSTKLEGNNGDSTVIYTDDLQPQGTKRTINIPTTVWNGEADKVFIVKIEAEDEHGAKSQKEYRIESTKEVLLDVNYDGGKGLVGEDIISNIEISNYEDSNISNIELEIGEYATALFENVTLSEYKFNSLVDGKISTVLTTRSTVEVDGSYIPLLIKYKAGNRERVIQTIIPIYSKEPYINVNVKSDVDLGEEFKPKLVLSQLEEVEENEAIIGVKDGYNVSWISDEDTTIGSGIYKIDINNLSDQSVIIGGYEIRRGEGEEISSESNEFTINYENPKVYINIILVIAVSDLEHGLYNGINNENGKVEILCDPEGFEVVNKMNVNYGATFILGGNGASINLELPVELVPYINATEVNLNNIKLYKANKSSSKFEYEEVAFNIERNVTYDTQKNEYFIKYSMKITDQIESDTQILLRYNADIPFNLNLQQYYNKITTGELSEDVKVYTVGTKLPDLY